MQPKLAPLAPKPPHLAPGKPQSGAPAVFRPAPAVVRGLAPAVFRPAPPVQAKLAGPQVYRHQPALQAKLAPPAPLALNAAPIIQRAAVNPAPKPPVFAPPPVLHPAAIQLSRRKKKRHTPTIQVEKTSGIIKSVTPSSSRGSTNLGGGRQGSHKTAHRVFQSIIRNNLMGETLLNAGVRLGAVMATVKTLRSVKNLKGQHKKNMDIVDTSIGAVTNLPTLEQATVNLTQFFNLIPGSASSSGDLRGHGEGSHNALLQEYEDRLRNSKTQRYTKQDVATSVWAMLDYKPGSTADEDDVAETLYRHLVFIRGGYPRTFADAKAEIYQYLKDNHATIYSGNLDNTTAVNAYTKALASAGTNGL